MILGEPWPCGTPHSASFAARAFALGGYKGRDRRGDNKRTTAREAAPRGRGADQDGRQETRDERQETERVIMTSRDNCIKMTKFDGGGVFMVGSWLNRKRGPTRRRDERGKRKYHGSGRQCKYYWLSIGCWARVAPTPRVAAPSGDCSAVGGYSLGALLDEVCAIWMAGAARSVVGARSKNFRLWIRNLGLMLLVGAWSLEEA